MSKRKASSPVDEMMNGDTGGGGRQLDDLISTPKRSFGGNITPTHLNLMGGSLLKNLDSEFSVKIKKLNVDLITTLVNTVKTSPDVCFVPTLNSYIDHVETLLKTHRRPPPVKSPLASGTSIIGGVVGGGIRQTNLFQKSPFNHVGESSSQNLKNQSHQLSILPPPPPLVSKSTTSSLITSIIPPLPPPASSSSSFGGHMVNSTASSFSAKPSVPFTSTFSFAPPPAQASTSAAAVSNDNDEETEEPPKNEFKPVVEEDSLYSVRCKVYGKVGEEFKDKGIGQLYVKKLESGKHQAVVRADNNLGTIILNILLQKGLPLSKKSAKDILTVDPNGEQGPMTVVIRVKSEEIAKELLDKLTHYSNLS